MFTRSGALNVLKSLGESARDIYAEDKNMEIPTEGLRIDITMKDGDSISLGEEKMVALETKGHTDCSMTFVFEPLSVMFGSESTGILEFGDISTPILKKLRRFYKISGKMQDIRSRTSCGSALRPYS